MNEVEFKGIWDQTKGKLKEHWGRLTDDDLAVIEGRQEQFLGKLQEIYGLARSDAERQLREFLVRPLREHRAAQRQNMRPG